MTQFETAASFREAIQGELPILVDFWAPWCMPCKIIAPVLEELADELDGKMDFGKLDIDEHPEISQEYNIQSIPTMIVFQKGKPIDKMIGVKKKDELLAVLQAHIS